MFSAAKSATKTICAQTCLWFFFEFFSSFFQLIGSEFGLVSNGFRSIKSFQKNMYINNYISSSSRGLPLVYIRNAVLHFMTWNEIICHSLQLSQTVCTLHSHSTYISNKFIYIGMFKYSILICNLETHCTICTHFYISSTIIFNFHHI